MTTPPTVTLVRDGDHGSVVIDQTFPTDPLDLWEAITDPARLARWIATVDGDPTDGGSFPLRFTSEWEGTGIIRACAPPEQFVLDTTSVDGDTTTITATITPEGDASRLRVEESGIVLSQLFAYGAGWHAHLDDLAATLAGQERGNWQQRWAQLAPSYKQLPVRDADA